VRPVSFWASTLLVLLLLLAHGAWAGATIVDGSLLGIDEAGLQQLLPTIRKTAKPAPGPRGVRGLWTLPNDMLAGMPFETIFFFRSHKLERIEQRRLVPLGQCSQQFDYLTSALEMRLGAAVRSSETGTSAPANRSAAWSLEAFRTAAFQMPSGSACTLMLVQEPLDSRDASSL